VSVVGRPARAAVFERPGGPFVVRPYPVPAVGLGEALVRVRMSTICRSDVHSWEGRRPSPVPGLLGHEIIGDLVALGAGVETDARGAPLRAGDRVTWSEYAACGACYYCRIVDLPQKCVWLWKYGHDSADVPPHLHGGFAEYCHLRAGTVMLRVPDELTDEEATPVNCGVATMVAATEAAGIGVGDAVVVQGLGLLGLYGVALARARGARLVVGLDEVPERLALARRLGAQRVIDVSGLADHDAVALVREACPPDGADAAIEASGAAKALAPGLRMLRKGGRYVTVGLVFPGAVVTLDASALVAGCVSLRGVHNYHPRHLVQALDFVTASRRLLPLGELVQGRFPLDGLDDAFAHAASRAVVRAAVVP
jgi:putative phosphonate catabolism associated alcohol dehydrogenase